jgi:hypothetical protein
MSDIKLLEQIKTYDKPWCYQYQRRLDTIEEDKKILGWNDEFISNIKLDDFVFSNVTSKEEKKECIDFIKRYEWLGDVSGFPMAWFTARYKGILGGVIIMSPPNAFSKLLGEGTENIEALITRGASASWCPFNLGSKFLMWCIKWMVNNTPYRLFTCYSDVQANEIGSIYQGLNFYYLGQASGTTVKAINPYNPNSLISDRTFRSRSMFKRYAKDLGIEWQSNWNDRSSVLWNNIPDDVEKRLREYSKEMFKNAEKVIFPNKHKYAFVLGRDKRETKQLRKKFLELNKVYDYPKERGK